MILPIGNSSRKGQTFIEVMAALVIFSVGITAVLKTYLISLNHMRYLTDRFYASMALDRYVAVIEREFKLKHQFPEYMDSIEPNGVNNLDFAADPVLKYKRVDNLDKIFEINFALKWVENNKPVEILRSGYIADF